MTGGIVPVGVLTMITMRRSLRTLAAPALVLAITATGAGQDEAAPPNVVYILADDLGYGEVGCYGQTKIRTPNIDALAAAGMRFTQHYSGSPVCASARCTLLTGKHTGHAYVRDNYEVGGWERGATEGQLPLPDEETTLAELLQTRGYATCAVGKWGLGGPESSGHPNRQGFDHWYGYLCQRIAHNYHPTHLWRNGEKHELRNEYFKAHQKLDAAPESADAYAAYAGPDFAPDLVIAEALSFIRASRDKPFFLYYATPVPHAAIQVPQDSLDQYADAFPETPYLGHKGYLPHPTPRAGYAAMVSRMDRDIGSILRLLDELGLAENTIVVFSSDNGPTFNGGTDSAFFESADGLRGLKTKLYEGGIRVPLIVRWPGHVEPGLVSDHVSAFWDILPTVCDVASIAPPEDIDGISLVPTLLGRPAEQKAHAYLYWERQGGSTLR